MAVLKIVKRDEKDKSYGVTEAGILETARVYMKRHVEKEGNTSTNLIRTIWEEATPYGEYTSKEIRLILGERFSENTITNEVSKLKKSGFLQSGKGFKRSYF